MENDIQSWGDRNDPATDRIYSKILDVLRPMCFGHIGPESRIYHDLGLSGEDAFEVITLLEKEYHVDLSRFEFSDFFPDEVMTVRDAKKYVKVFIGAGSPWRAVSVEDLVRIAKSGEWDI